MKIVNCRRVCYTLLATGYGKYLTLTSFSSPQHRVQESATWPQACKACTEIAARCQGTCIARSNKRTFCKASACVVLCIIAVVNCKSYSVLAVHTAHTTHGCLLCGRTGCQGCHASACSIAVLKLSKRDGCSSHGICIALASHLSHLS